MANDIVVQLDGDAEQSPKFGDFVAVCDSLKACLANVSRCIAGQEADFAVSDLRYGSAVLTVAPLANGVPLNVGEDIASTFKRAVRAIQYGEQPDERLDLAAIDAFRGFSKLAKRTDTAIAIDGIRLTTAFAANLMRLLDRAPPSRGSVRGQLEAVSIHSEKPVFWLYPPAGESVKCSFKKDELNRVLRAVDRSVTVYGKLTYARGRAFPESVVVDSFDVNLPDNELPDWIESKGFLRDCQQKGDWRDGW